MPWTILAAARREVREATLYYLGEGGAALALRLQQELAMTLELLDQHPQLGTPDPSKPLAARGIRHWPLRRFPYTIVYRLQGEHRVLLALAHQRRAPAYWTGRR